MMDEKFGGLEDMVGVHEVFIVGRNERREGRQQAAGSRKQR